MGLTHHTHMVLVQRVTNKVVEAAADDETTYKRIFLTRDAHLDWLAAALRDPKSAIRQEIPAIAGVTRNHSGAGPLNKRDKALLEDMVTDLKGGLSESHKSLWSLFEDLDSRETENEIVYSYRKTRTKRTYVEIEGVASAANIAKAEQIKFFGYLDDSTRTVQTLLRIANKTNQLLRITDVQAPTTDTGGTAGDAFSRTWGNAAFDLGPGDENNSVAANTITVSFGWTANITAERTKTGAIKVVYSVDGGGTTNEWNFRLYAKLRPKNAPTASFREEKFRESADPEDDDECWY